MKILNKTMGAGIAIFLLGFKAISAPTPPPNHDPLLADSSSVVIPPSAIIKPAVPLPSQGVRPAVTKKAVVVQHGSAILEKKAAVPPANPTMIVPVKK